MLNICLIVMRQPSNCSFLGVEGGAIDNLTETFV